MVLDGVVFQLNAKSHRERHVSGHVPCDNLPVLGESLASDHPVAVDLTITRANEKWHVAGSLVYWARFSCSRCLLSSEREHRVVVERDFCVGPDPSQGKKNKAMEDDSTYLESGELSVQDLVQEEILLDYPMTPLCSDSCQGLCPHCGTNRNRDRCLCDGKTREGPFAKLKELKLS